MLGNRQVTSIFRWHFMGDTKCAECRNKNVKCIQMGMKLACCFPTKCDHYKSTIQFCTSFYFHLYARMNFHMALKLHDQDNVIIYLSIWHLYPITKVFQTQVSFKHTFLNSLSQFLVYAWVDDGFRILIQTKHYGIFSTTRQPSCDFTVYPVDKNG